MVRRKAVGVGRQLSLSAYQPLPSQGGCFRAPSQQSLLVPSMAEYWQNMCNKLSGALPRMAMLVPPEPSSRRLTRLRRQMMWSPREIVYVPHSKGMGMVQGNYVRQQQQQAQIQQLSRQQAYPPTWGRSQWQGPPPATPKCRPVESSAWGHYHSSGTMAQQRQKSVNSPNFIACPGSQAEVPVCDFESEASRFAATASRIEMQQKELHEKQLQLQKLQESHFSPQPSQVILPVGILKKPARPEGGQSSDTELHPKNAKRVKVEGMDGMLHERVMAPNNPKPLPAPRRRWSSSQKQEPQRDPHQEHHPQGYQRKYHQEHPAKPMKVPQQQQSACTFNFGKFVSNFTDGYDRNSVSQGTAPIHKSKKSSKVCPKVFSKVCSNAGSARRRPPEWPKVDRILRRLEPETCKRGRKRSSRILPDHQVDQLDSGSSTSTLTAVMSSESLENAGQSREHSKTPFLTVENDRRGKILPKTPHQSQTSIKSEQEESSARERQGSSLDVYARTFEQAPVEEQPDSTTKKSRIRRVNINQLLQNQEHQDGNAVWESLVQLVDQMCDPLEDEEEQQQNEVPEENRLIAGFGTDRRQNKKRKQYSVYLMVNSDVDDEDDSLPKQQMESPVIVAESNNHNQISYGRPNHNPILDERHILNHPEIRQDHYANQCYRFFQEEQRRPSHRKRKRRSGSRIKELAYPYPIPPPGQTLRRPLHWPKPDMSRPQTRQQRPRSISKPPAKKRLQRSISAVQEAQRLHRLWEKVPLANPSCMMYPTMNSTRRRHY